MADDDVLTDPSGQAAIAGQIRARAAVDPGYVSRLFQIESGGDPNAVTGSNRGLGQFGPQEEARYGITDANRGDYGAQAAAVQREAAEHARALSATLGRPPSPGELYLTHQQGIAGGPALLTADASQPAWQAVRPFYRSDAVAQKAISGNIPNGHPLSGQDVNTITAGDFRNLWISKFERGLGNGSVATAPSSGGSAAPGAQGAPLGMAGAPAPTAGAAFAAPSGQPSEDELAALTPPQQTGQDQLQPAPPLDPIRMPQNLARLRAAVAARQGGPAGGMQMAPSVAQRLAALIGQRTI
jgi:hypothetical protein